MTADIDQPKAMRLFIGAPITVECAEALRRTAGELARAAEAAGHPIRWVAPASYHVTLRFLGWTRPALEPALRDRVADALEGERELSFRVAGLGAFPRAEAARVLWAGIEDGGGLARIAAALEEAVIELGFVAEKRPFHPHITLGRVRKVADLGGLLLDSEHTSSKVLCEAVNLYESKTKSTGSEYSVRTRWPLARRSKPSTSEA
jgi:2'-5' RNA ligase